MLFDNHLSFFDMQIKWLFLKPPRKTENIYRKTIKKVCFTINMQVNCSYKGGNRCFRSALGGKERILKYLNKELTKHE